MVGAVLAWFAEHPRTGQEDPEKQNTNQQQNGRGKIEILALLLNIAVIMLLFVCWIEISLISFLLKNN